MASDIARSASSEAVPLRDEILVVRHLFGYCETGRLPLTVGKSSLGAALPNSLMKDVLLIGIDVDTYQGYERLATDPQLHIGISVLDTRLLHTLTLEETSVVREADPIESYQFVIGDSRYCKTASRKFLFGKSQSIPLTEAKAQIESLICSRSRDIILVFHGDHSDRKALLNLNINLQPLYVIDNVKAAQYPLGLHYRLGLEAMLDTFGIPYTNLHAAGNDAHYALRSLLMIAVTDAERMGSDSAHRSLLETFIAIARKPRPTTAAEKENLLNEARHQKNIDKKARHKAKRAARTERRKRERENRAKIEDTCASTEEGAITDGE
ncbi:hypothetical protein F5Y10DRAFT_283967 [Nemania abortiva]|nr:hypothetical protein F5Y10DRAFT_283967 [Nemania abortiva]